MTRRLRALVWNAAERRPRAGWRLLLAAVAYPALALPGVAAAGLVAPALPVTLDSTTGLLLVGAPVQSLAAALLLGTFALAVDRRRVADYGLGLDAGWWRDAAAGLALGAGLMTLVFLAGLTAGWVRVVGTLTAPGPFLPWFLGVVLATVAVGVYEEALLRGYLLTNAAEGLARFGPTAAVAGGTALSALLFGALHAGNPNATLASGLSITLAGAVLGLGYALTGNLALPIGLHVSWNLFQGTVYGFPVSGADLGVGLLAVAVEGPPAVTGGAFGPEAGLLGVGALLLGAAAIAAWARHRTGSLQVRASVADPDLRWRPAGSDTDTDGDSPAPSAEDTSDPPVDGDAPDSPADGDG